MLKNLTFLILLFAVISLASAQVIRVEMDPNILLPNDIAYCKIIFTPQRDTYVSGISVFSPSGIDVEPSGVSGVGMIPAGSSYEFPFTIKAERSGVHTLTAYIYTFNGTVKQPIVVRVLDIMPEIVLDKTFLRLNEVNEVSFSVTTPIKLDEIIVEPLFDANPKIIRIADGKGEFKFEPLKEEPLRFKIKFYNGKNYHEIVRTINVTYVQSRGILIDASPRYLNTPIGDVNPIDIQITNLRTDTVYSISIKAEGEILSSDEIQAPQLKPEETFSTEILFCSRKSGYHQINFTACYLDELNYKHCKVKSVSINVLNESALKLSGIETEISAHGLTITGDVSNNGKSVAYNILISAISENLTKTYYIDQLDPFDFDSFEFTFPITTKTVLLKLQWKNEMGESFEESEVVEINSLTAATERSPQFTHIIPVIVLIFVLIIVIFAWKRR
uniref:CARDB domain-containing protein n=2 Tax=Geoglobus ahangari TaxID=113653 RepID=A0A7C4WKV6_9EURY